MEDIPGRIAKIRLNCKCNSKCVQKKAKDESGQTFREFFKSLPLFATDRLAAEYATAAEYHRISGNVNWDIPYRNHALP